MAHTLSNLLRLWASDIPNGSSNTQITDAVALLMLSWSWYFRCEQSQPPVHLRDFLKPGQNIEHMLRGLQTCDCWGFESWFKEHLYEELFKEVLWERHFSGNIHPEVLEASPSMFTYCNYVLVVSPFMSQRLNQVSIHRHRWIQPCKADSVFHYWGRTQQRMNESEVNNCAMNAFGGSIFACPEKWVWHESTRTSLTAQILYSQPRNMPRLIKPSVVSPKLGPCVPK